MFRWHAPGPMCVLSSLPGDQRFCAWIYRTGSFFPVVERNDWCLLLAPIPPVPLAVRAAAVSCPAGRFRRWGRGWVGAVALWPLDAIGRRWRAWWAYRPPPGALSGNTSPLTPGGGFRQGGGVRVYRVPRQRIAYRRGSGRVKEWGRGAEEGDLSYMRFRVAPLFGPTHFLQIPLNRPGGGIHADLGQGGDQIRRGEQLAATLLDDHADMGLPVLFHRGPVALQ